MGTLNVRCKFRVQSVMKSADGTEVVRAHPVRASPADNEEWAKYTPSGEFWIQITQAGAQGRFEPGQEFYLDATPIEAPAAPPV